VTNATKASPIVITSPNHGLTTGHQVIVSGVGGNTAANGLFPITRIDANTFRLDGSTGNGDYAANTGSFLASANLYTLTATSPNNPRLTLTPGFLVENVTSTTPIVVTSSNHRLATGSRVVIGGVNGTGNANGRFTVTKIDDNSFSLDGTKGEGAYTGGGTALAVANATKASPIVITARTTTLPPPRR
jgi:hypothetical protein